MKWPGSKPLLQRRSVALVVLGFALLGGLLFVFLLRADSGRQAESVSLTTLVQNIKKNEVAEIRVSDTGGVATSRSGQLSTFTTQSGEHILKVLTNLGA